MRVTIELDNVNDATRCLNLLSGHTPAPAPPQPAPAPPQPAPAPPQPAPAPPQPAHTDGVGSQWPQNGRDSAGVPWDARIHSSNQKCTVKDGRWRQKRGVDPGLFASVTASLLNAPVVSEAPPPPAPAPVVNAPPPPAPAPVVSEAPPQTFPDFMRWVGKQNKKYTDTEGLNELVSKVGLQSIGLLAVNTQHIPALVEIVKNESA